MFMKKRRECHEKKYNVKEHSVIIIILNCYAGNYFSNFNLLKKILLLVFRIRNDGDNEN